jgi:signal transduction histidine kinase
VFKNLPTGIKLILLCSTFLVALIVATYGLIAEKRIAIEFARKELVGTQYLDTVRSVYAAILEESPAGHGNWSPEPTLKALNAAETAAAGRLKSAELQQSLVATLRELWPANSDDGQYGLIVLEALTKTRRLAQRIGDESNLTLDPDLDSYYLQNLVIEKLPLHLGHLGEMQSLLRQALASGSSLSGHRVRLRVLEGLIRSNLDLVEANLSAAARADSRRGASQRLDAAISAMVSGTNSYLGANGSFGEGGPLLIAASASGKEYAGAVHSTLAAWEAIRGELDRLLNRRIDGLLDRLYRSLLVIGALACLSIALAMMTHRHIVQPLARLEDVARTVRQTRNYSLRSEHASRDEIGSLAAAFNDMMSELGAARDRETADQARSAAMHSELARVARLTTLGEMAASIAHEINQPLAAIVANGNAGLRWLSNAAPDVGETQAALKRVVSDGHRASRVIRSIRAIFRDAGHEKAPVAINPVIEEVLALLSGQLHSRDIQVHSELEAELPQVAADSVQLQQVLLNLITNAVEAMSAVTDRPRVLDISSSIHDHESVLITISDSGTGIDPEHVGRIFEAFFTTKSSGTGLGLSICRSIVDAHGGRLWASAGAPHGSVFSILLPSSASRQ